MTIDEAIADCVRQVPEVWPRPFPLVDCVSVDEVRHFVRASWFHAAFVWLTKHGRPDFFESNGDKFSYWNDQGSDYIDVPTEFHAMRAALLLAKGLKP